MAQIEESVPTGMFYMWRCVIALAHIDGHFHDAERAYLDRVFANMDRGYGLTEDQKQTIADDYKNPKKIGDLIRYINDPRWRGELIYFGGLMARADGDLHPDEDAILKKLHAEQMDSLDMEQIRKQAKEAVADETFQHDLDLGEIRASGGYLLPLLDRLLLHIGIDLFK